MSLTSFPEDMANLLPLWQRQCLFYIKQIKYVNTVKIYYRQIGVFGAVIGAFLSMQNNMLNFLKQVGRFPEQLSYAGDYCAFLDTPEESEGELPYPGLSGNITLDDISFKYPMSGMHYNKYY